MRSGIIGLTLTLAVALLSLGLRPCEGDYEPPESAPDLADCEYEQPPPSRSNQVQIDGGATCAEAGQLVRFGPAVAEFKRHPVTFAGDEERIEGDWVCEAERSAFRAPTVDILCEHGKKRIAYVLP